MVLGNPAFWEATYAAVLAMLANMPGPAGAAAAGAAPGAAAAGGGAARFGGYAAVVAGRVCCFGATDGRAGATVGLEGRLPPPDLP